MHSNSMVMEAIAALLGGDANQIIGNTSLVSSCSFSGPVTLATLIGYNPGNEQFVMLFAGTSATPGSAGLASFPIDQGNYFSFDLSAFGVSFPGGCCAAFSSTANTYTPGTTGTIQGIVR